MRRTTLVTISIAGHFALGIGLFASGVWKLERLEADRRLANIGVMTPTQVAGGSPENLPAPKFVKKDTDKKVVKNTQPPTKRNEDDKPSTQVSTGGTGTGTGDGPETGETGGIGGGVTCEAIDCTGTAPPEPPKPPEPPPVVRTVAPTVLAALRIQGDTQIHPSTNTKNQILTDGKKQVVGTLKVCIQTTGAISSVSVIGSTKYPEYDQTLVENVRRWQYRPLLVNGTPQPACSAVSFVYSIK